MARGAPLVPSTSRGDLFVVFSGLALSFLGLPLLPIFDALLHGLSLDKVISTYAKDFCGPPLALETLLSLFAFDVLPVSSLAKASEQL